MGGGAVSKAGIGILGVLLMIPLSIGIRYLFVYLVKFFNWISEGIALRLMRRRIPPELRQPLPVPQTEEEIPGIMETPQIPLLAQWTLLRNRVHLWLSVGLFLVLVPVLLLVLIDDVTLQWLAAGMAIFILGMMVISAWHDFLRPENRFVEGLEKNWAETLAPAKEEERLKLAVGLAEGWNERVALLEKSDRKRGVVLLCGGAVLAGLLTWVLLYSTVLVREVSPGVYQLRGFRYRLLEDGTAEITGHVGVGSSLSIPDRVGNIQVTAIGDGAFGSCYDLKKVTLPEDLREIGNRAFGNCLNLEEIRFPDSLRVIGDRAFMSCWRLQENRLPAGLQRLGDYAFAEAGFSRLELPEGLEYLGTQALNGSVLKHVTFPDSLREVKGNPFYRPGGSLEIVISPDHPTLKWENGLLLSRDGTRLLSAVNIGESCTVPEGVRSVAAYAFFGNKSVRFLTLPDTLREIGMNAFEGCKALETAALPEGLTRVPADAFRGCEALRTCTFPGSLRQIGERAFLDCHGLTQALLPKGLVSIESSAFKNCTKLTQAVLPEGLVSIGISAFSNCRSLTEITLPESLQDVGIDAFADCKGLQRVFLPAREIGGIWFSLGNVFNKAPETLVYRVYPDTWAFSQCVRHGYRYELVEE